MMIRDSGLLFWATLYSLQISKTNDHAIKASDKKHHTLNKTTLLT